MITFGYFVWFFFQFLIIWLKFLYKSSWTYQILYWCEFKVLTNRVAYLPNIRLQSNENRMKYIGLYKYCPNSFFNLQPSSESSYQFLPKIWYVWLAKKFSLYWLSEIIRGSVMETNILLDPAATYLGMRVNWFNTGVECQW